MFNSNEAETISSLDDIYQVGAFVQITELYDMGDKMRMVVLGHRRFVYYSVHVTLFGLKGVSEINFLLEVQGK